VSKNLREFYQDKRAKGGFGSKCKPCKKEGNRAYRKTLPGALVTLAVNARGDSVKLAAKGRVTAGVCTIDADALRELYDVQEGKCFFSGIPMGIGQREWKMSLKRFDTDVGYIPGNITLCAVEFNMQHMWSLATVEEVVRNHLSGDTTPVHLDIDFYPDRKESERRPDTFSEIRDGELFYECIHCCDFHAAADFLEDRLADGCLSCRSRTALESASTPRGHLKQLVRTAPKTTKKRNKNAARTPTVCDVTLEDLVAQFELQGGRCAISKMPLQFGPGNGWACSLERGDVNVGYTRENISLIAAFFQAQDCTAVMDPDPDDDTSPAWTRQKFLMFIDFARVQFGL
jgi:hypothetical protein